MRLRRLLLVMPFIAGCEGNVFYDPADWAGDTGQTWPSYDDVRAACDLAPGETIPSIWTYWDGFDPWGEEAQTDWSGLVTLDRPLSAECAALAGEAVGLDWESFDSEPHDLDTIETAVDVVVTGLVQLVAADYGTVGDLAAQVGPDELLSQEYPDGLLAVYAADEPGGRMWYDFVSSRVDALVMEPHCGMLVIMRAGGGTVRYCLNEHQTMSVTSFLYYLAPPTLGSVFVHEAAHRNGYPHNESNGDDDCNGAYGAQARNLSRWLSVSGPAASEVANEVAVQVLTYTCEQIASIDADCACP